MHDFPKRLNPHQRTKRARDRIESGPGRRLQPQGEVERRRRSEAADAVRRRHGWRHELGLVGAGADPAAGVVRAHRAGEELDLSDLLLRRLLAGQCSPLPVPDQERRRLTLRSAYDAAL
jgi:hypothetical protein